MDPRLDLPVGILSQAYSTRPAKAFQPRRNVHPIPHQIAVGLLDHVAEMYANAKCDALVGRDFGVALDHRSLDFNGTVHRVDDAAELDYGAVAGALDDPTMMHGDSRIGQVAPKGAEPSENSILVRPRKPE